MRVPHGGNVAPKSWDRGCTGVNDLNSTVWSNWGSARSSGVGTTTLNDCVPSCAQGTVTTARTRAVVSRIRRCRNGRGVLQRFTLVSGSARMRGPSSYLPPLVRLRAVQMVNTRVDLKALPWWEYNNCKPSCPEARTSHYAVREEAAALEGTCGRRSPPLRAAPARAAAPAAARTPPPLLPRRKRRRCRSFGCPASVRH